MVEVKGNSLYADNRVTTTVVKAATQLLECFDEIEVSFDVIGRTCHQLLAHQLHKELGTDKYIAEITYNYGCKIIRKEKLGC